MITSEEKIMLLSAAEPGELIRIALREDVVFGIVVGQEKRNTIIISLQPVSKKAPYPYHLGLVSERRAVSYGLDWYLEALPGNEFVVGAPSFRYASGSIRLQDNHWILTAHAAEDDHMHGEIYYNLSLNELTDSPDNNDTAPVQRWRIWRNEAEYLQQIGDGLITVQAVDLS